MKTLTLLTLLSSSLWSVEVSESLKLRNENAFLTHDGAVQKAVGYGKLELEFIFEDDIRMLTSSMVEGDFKDTIEPNRLQTPNYSSASKPLALGNRGRAELREFYYEKEFGDTQVKLGKMQSVWGKADGIKLIDKLNPQDFSEFILAPFEESRIPLWSLSLQQNFQASELELLVIPDNTYNKLPTGVYGFTSSRIVPQRVEGIAVNQNEATRPNDADIALRYSMQLANMELGFYGLYAYEDTPVLFQDLDRNTRTMTLNPEYKRSKFFGTSLDYSKGDFVYRLEVGFTEGKYYLNSSEARGVAQSDEVAYIFGVDWYGLDESLLSMQINQSYLLSNKDGFTRPKLDNTVTLLYKKDLMHNTLHGEILAIHNINDGDGLLRPKLSYELDEESLVYTGLDVFYGDRDGLYGQFRGQNRVVLGVERTF